MSTNCRSFVVWNSTAAEESKAHANIEDVVQKVKQVNRVSWLVTEFTDATHNHKVMGHVTQTCSKDLLILPPSSGDMEQTQGDSKLVCTGFVNTERSEQAWTGVTVHCWLRW